VRVLGLATRFWTVDRSQAPNLILRPWSLRDVALHAGETIGAAGEWFVCPPPRARVPPLTRTGAGFCASTTSSSSSTELSLSGRDSGVVYVVLSDLSGPKVVDVYPLRSPERSASDLPAT
jgi:hypothetical protein